MTQDKKGIIKAIVMVLLQQGWAEKLEPRAD